MIVKFLSTSIFLLIITTGTGAACAAEQTSFKSAAAYMASTWGPDYKADENLKVSQRKFGSQTFTHVADYTPTTNVVHTLFRRDPRKGLCMVLRSNPMISLEVTKKDKFGKPLEIKGSSQAPGTEPSVEVTYTLSKSGVYAPSRCRHLTYSEANKEVAEVVPCDKVLSDLN